MRKSKIMAAALAAVMLVTGVTGVSAAHTATTGVGIGFATPGTIVPPTPGTGSLVLTWIPSALSFGTANALPAAGADTFPLDSTTAQSRWIEVQDSRNAATTGSVSLTNEWELKASLSTLTDGTTTLNATSLSFNIAQSGTHTGLSVPTASTVNAFNPLVDGVTAVSGAVTLNSGATATTIMSADDATLTAPGLLPDVQAAMCLDTFALTVPSATSNAVLGGQYAGTILWELEDTI